MIAKRQDEKCSAIHITCGDVVASSVVEGLGIAWDSVVSLRDTLWCGPLGEMRDLSSWQAARLAFWAEFDREREPPTRRRRRRQEWPLYRGLDKPDRLINADEIVLWLGPELADQLTLAWVPQLLRALGLPTDRLRVVQFIRAAERESPPDLGVLCADEAQAAPAKSQLSAVELAYLDEAWKSVIARDPMTLLDLLDRARPPLPLLEVALHRLLWRYPDSQSGVNRFESRLLANTRNHGPTAAPVIAESLFDSEKDGDSAGDNWLWWRLKRLADPVLPHPAVAMTGKRTMIGDTEVRLTAVGERILKGELNFVELNGIDDWIGGVHLDSRAGSVWSYRDGSLVRG